MHNHHFCYLLRTDSSIFTSHLYEHIVLRELMKCLSNNGYGYFSLIGNLSARTFNKYIMIYGDIYYGDVDAVYRTINDFFNNNSIMINDDIINREISRISVEDGCLYNVKDKTILISELLKLNEQKFIPIDGILSRYDKPRTINESDNVASVFMPTEFRDITINLYIDNPTLADKITIVCTDNLIAELLLMAINDINGYVDNVQIEVIDCIEDAILLRFETKINKSIDNVTIKESINKTIAMTMKDNSLKTLLDNYYRELELAGDFYANKYAAIGALMSEDEIKKIVKADSFIDTLDKLQIGDIIDWDPVDGYIELSQERLER